MRFYNFKSFYNNIIYICWAKFSAGDLCSRKENDLLLCLGDELWWYKSEEYIYTESTKDEKDNKIKWQPTDINNILDLIVDTYNPDQIALQSKERSEYINNINKNNEEDQVSYKWGLPVIYIKDFLTSKTMQVIHILARMYFTDIGHIIKLWIHDIDSIIKHKKDKKNKNKASQRLYIYSDLRSITNGDSVIWENLEIISSYPTEVQQSKLFRGVKNGFVEWLVCTHGIIFQDWANLGDIYIYDSRRWYYKNMKDPRYETLEVVKIMADIYGSQLHIM